MGRFTVSVGVGREGVVTGEGDGGGDCAGGNGGGFCGGWRGELEGGLGGGEIGVAVSNTGFDILNAHFPGTPKFESVVREFKFCVPE